MDCYGFMCDNLLNKLCVGLYEAGNGRETQVHKVNLRFVICRE